MASPTSRAPPPPSSPSPSHSSRIARSPPPPPPPSRPRTPTTPRHQHQDAAGYLTPTRTTARIALRSPVAQSLEMQEISSPVQQFHTPPQLLSSSPFQQASPTLIQRASSPKPLLLAASHHLLSSPDLEGRKAAAARGAIVDYSGNGLLPSPMPLPTQDGAHGLGLDDPFNDARVPSNSPPALKSAFNISPPISPADSTMTTSSATPLKDKEQKPAGPPPLFKPSLGLLFSLSTRRDKLTLLLPASLFSLGAGVIPPLMTFVLGEAFDAFAKYQQATGGVPFPDMRSANDDLKSDMLRVAIKLIVLGVLSVTLNTIALTLWVWHGERIARRLRRAVYIGIVKKPMSWFDLGMGRRAGSGGNEGESQEQDEDEETSEENESSGGLMGRFSRETDDVRMALASVIGRVIGSICTILAGLAVAFYHSYQLTFVIIGTSPVIALVVVLIEVFVTPMMIAERNINASAASRIERVTGAISTVKAFNAEQGELTSFIGLATKSAALYKRITLLWGFRAGFVQFLLLSMFVTGFWFGNFLVASGRKTAGDVTIVFWATLLASSNMQASLPLLNTLDKAKVAMAAWLETAHDTPDLPANGGGDRPNSDTDLDMKKSPIPIHVIGSGDSPPSSPHQPGSLSPSVNPVQPTRSPRTRRIQMMASRKARGYHGRNGSLGVGGPAMRTMKKMHPSKFTGELALQEVTFHYPSRPHPAPPALNKVSLFLPARDTTYIVGGSGSGKSTVGSLLLGLYKPESGRIEADEQGIEWLDEKWLRGHIGMVSQGASVLFEGTVHENVALGVVGVTGSKKRNPEDVTREEVTRACRAALFHDFVRDLPDGYDTMLSGERGASLSGGQRQRLAIARAYIRDPTVLVLDEATSALDTVSRHLIHEAIKNWRKNRTTIIITHDLTPITGTDFVYVMKDGEVVEQGYRSELEAAADGWFSHLATTQLANPNISDGGKDDDKSMLYHEATEVLNVPDVMVTPPRPMRPSMSHRLSSSPASFVAPNGADDIGSHLRDFKKIQRLSRNFMEEQEQRRSIHGSGGSRPERGQSPRRPEISPSHSFNSPTGYPVSPPRTDSLPVPHLGMSRSSSAQSFESTASKRQSNYRDSSMSYGALERVGMASSARRPANGRLSVQQQRLQNRSSWHHLKEVVSGEQIMAPVQPTIATLAALEGKDGKDGDAVVHPLEQPQVMMMSLPKIFKVMLPMVPSKFGLVIGLFLCVGSGVCTPLFSNLFSQMIASLGAPGSINLLRTALLLLLIAALDGLAQWGKYTILQHVAMGWILKMQKETFTTVLYQERSWFDQPTNIPVNIVSTLVKDAEDARNLIGYVAGNLCTVAAMLFLGIIWAAVAGWQLTLVGLALGPLFALSTVASTRILGAYERVNKAQREDCARKFFTAVSNVKVIRSMSLEPVFLAKFDKALEDTYRSGRKSALPTGFGSGIAFFTIYMAQAVMFLVGSIFIANGWYTFPQMLQVFVLLIFSVTFASQVLQNIPAITKAKFAATDLLKMHQLSSETAESQGRMTFPVQGRITFDNVSFNYPTRPDAKVLENVSFEISPGECVGIVGPSGSGKSTIATLLQRLYEPASGGIKIDGRPLARIDTKYLRDHVAVISQHPALFDMSVADNITYGCASATQADVERAAKLASVHDFIMTLPEGYKTHLGENAGLISGGQGQRLQIARALVHPREIILGDEITSALDTENQDAIMRTMLEVKQGRTTILITHKVSTMKTCDRLIVVENGRIVQQGTFDALVAQRQGVFSSLAGAGEWGA